jgi:hypothetical protein
MQNSDVPFYDEDIIDNFEVEELEDRLENKWGGDPPCNHGPFHGGECIDF